MYIFLAVSFLPRFLPNLTYTSLLALACYTFRYFIFLDLILLVTFGEGILTVHTVTEYFPCFAKFI
jgi:hypothetical protein